MGDECRADCEEPQHGGCDAGLEADEDGKSAEQFDKADDHSRDGRHGQADRPNQPAVAEMAVSLPKPARMNMADSRMRPTRIATEVFVDVPV